jgi:hypothetical protein
MATVHFGRLEAVGGFARVVAIKRLHPHYAENRELAARFFDEAKLATRVRHTNVVPTIDVALDGDVGLVVMEYVQGEALGRLLQVACKSDEPPPAPIVSAIMSGVLHGLHAAHQAKNERGEPLGIVHRDVSPQNILVGSDGVARVLDFGIAKATNQTAVTPGIKVKGKAAYLAPEQLRGQPVTPSTDVFAAAIVLWESLVGRRLFLDETEAKTLSNVLSMPIDPPSAFVPSLPPDLDRVVLRGLERDPLERFVSARDMAVALERACTPASAALVGAWVEGLASEALASRAAALRQVETWPGGGSSEEPPATSLPRSVRPEGVPRRRRVLEITACLILLAVGTATLTRAFRGPHEAAPTPAPARQLVESSMVEAVPAMSASEPGVPAMRPERVIGKRHVARPAAAAAADCTPPYSYNALGHKVFKPQCF